MEHSKRQVCPQARTPLAVARYLHRNNFRNPIVEIGRLRTMNPANCGQMAKIASTTVETQLYSHFPHVELLNTEHYFCFRSVLPPDTLRPGSWRSYQPGPRVRAVNTFTWRTWLSAICQKVP